MLEGQLDRFFMYDDETPQEIFNRLKKMVDKAKALGSKRWADCMLTEHLMRAYTPMNYNMVDLIHQDPIYKKMTSDNMLGRIMNHEMHIDEANHIKNLGKGATTTKKQEIAFKTSKKSKNNQRPKEYATIMVSMVISLLIVLLSVGMIMMTRRRVSSTRRRKSYKKDDKHYKKKSYGKAHIGQEWDSNDESSNSDDNGVATVVIKGTFSSSKSLFPKLNQWKHVTPRVSKPHDYANHMFMRL
jgi:hypothetical protein